MSKYNSAKIAKELQATADGNSYYGNALYVALDHPEATKNDKQMIMRYLYGSELLADRFRLQDLAIKISNYIEG